MKHKRILFNSAIVRFAAILLALAMVFGVLIAVTSRRLADMQKESAHQYLLHNLRTVSATADQIMRNLEFSYTPLFTDNNFINSVRRLAPYDEREGYSDYLHSSAIRDGIRGTAAANDYIYSVYAYSFTAQRFFSSRTNYDPSFNHFSGEGVTWLKTYAQYSPTVPWHISADIEENSPILTSYRTIKYGLEDPYGLISINLDARTITNLLADATPNQPGYTFIVDSNGNTLGTAPPQTGELTNTLAQHYKQDGGEGFFSINLNGQELFASYHVSAYSGFTYVTATTLSNIQTAVPVLQTLLFVFVGLLVVILVSALVLTSHYFFVPIKALFAGMKEVKQGNFEARLPQNTTYEFSYINRNFNEMVENLQQLISENYTSQLVNKEAQLRNIQNQLNEHFLYNTLDTIHWLARKEGAQKVCDIVFALAKFYRLSLSFGRDVISVKDVAEMQQHYLYIQEKRTAGALHYSIQCDDDIADEMVLKNMLQPLVENAVIHGLKGIRRDGKIEVSITHSENKMHVCVKDNGNGFTPQQLAEVRKQLELTDPYCDHSFALKTLQSQLQIFYGVDIRLNIETEESKGATVWFELPLYRNLPKPKED